MSASDDNPFGDGSPTDILGGTLGWLGTEGNTLGTLLQSSVFGLLVSVAVGGVNLIQSIFGLFVAPLDALATTVSTVVSATILEPLGIIETTAQTSAVSISSQFGPFALLAGVGVVLGAFLIINRFLQIESTSNIIPLPTDLDIPDIGPLDVGTDEDDQNDEGI